MLSDIPSDSIRDFSDQVVNDPSSLLFGSLADFYRENGLYQEAIGICLNGLESHPDNIEGRLVLAQCYKAINDGEKARAELTKVLSVQPQNSLAQKVLAELDKSVPSGVVPSEGSNDSETPLRQLPEPPPAAEPEPQEPVLPDIQSFHKGAQAMMELAAAPSEKPRMEYVPPESVNIIPPETAGRRTQDHEAASGSPGTPRPSVSDDRTMNAYARILNEMIQTPQVLSSLLVDESGYPVASAFAPGTAADEESSGALSALVFTTASQAMQKVKLGELERVVIDTKNEKIFLSRAGSQLLMVSAESTAKTGLVAVNVKRAIDRVKSLSS